MRRDLFVLVLLAGVAGTGCSMANRLTFIRPSAERGKVTQVAPVYDVSDKKKPGKDSPYAASELVASAVAQYRTGNLAEAQQMAARALKMDPSSADANSLLGMLSERGGKAAAAGAYYQKAATLAPASGIHANNYGTWLCGNGRAAESLGWFDKALADPNYPTRAAALGNAGTCANLAGQVDRAEASWRSALALDAGELQSLSGMAALQFARGQYLDARAFAERWLALAPADAGGLQLASRIEQKLGDNAAAQRYLSRLQAITPGTSTVPRAQ